MSQVYYFARPRPQEDMPDERQHRRQLAQQLGNVISGRLDCTLQVTLTANVATTTIIDSRISLQTAVIPVPMTAHAAAEVPTLWMVPSDGQCVMNHANNAQTDRTFQVALVG